MPTYVCSLKMDQPQSIPAGSGYTIVRFPFDESYDPHDMHPQVQPDTGQAVDYASPRAGLIWPAHDAWARLDALLYWEAGDYDEVRDRFVRDPLDLSTGYDSTCTEDRQATVGGQFNAKSWPMFVHPGTPLAVLVRHNAPVAVRLMLAELKLSYHLDPVLP